MKPLDFLIIGAQKCATTTLFEHLRRHPEINMPLEKEVPFFTGPDCSETCWEAFAAEQFGEDDGRLWGKATPQYMCDPDAAWRIHALMPGTRLVAILRDPLQRTLSHYQMGRRRETEARPFDQAMAELLAPEALERVRKEAVPTHATGYEPESDFYVAWSEYGRVLEQYALLFGSGQLLVLYTEDLERDPAGTLDRLLEFIGLEPGFRPETLGDVMHKGGGSNLVPHSWRVWLRERRVISTIWRWVPPRQQGRLRFLYERWNTRKSGSSSVPVSDTTAALLRGHFARDLARLERLQCPRPPWLDDYLAA